MEAQEAVQWKPAGEKNRAINGSRESKVEMVAAISGSRVAAVVGVERIVGVSRGSQLLTHKHLLPSQPVLENSCALELLSSSRTK